MLLLADVYDYILIAGAFAHYLAHVYGYARAYEHAAPILSVKEAVAVGIAGLGADKAAVGTLLDISLIRLILVEYAAHYAVAPGIGQQLVAVAQKASGGYVEQQPYACAVGLGYHVYPLGLAAAKLFHYRAHIILRHVYGQLLDGLKEGAVRSLMVYHLRAGYGKFVVLPSHLLYQYGEMQLAASAHLEHIRGFGFLYPHGYVGLYLLEQPVAKVPACDVLAFLACKGAVVYHEHHGKGWLVYLYEGQRIDVIHIAHRLAYGKVGYAGHGHYLACARFLYLYPFQALKPVQAGDLHLPGILGRAAAEHRCLVAAYPAALYPANSYAAYIVIIVQRGKQHLKGALVIAAGRRHGAYYGIEKGLHIGAQVVGIKTAVSVPCGSVHHREVQLLGGSAKVYEQLHYLVHHLQRACAGAVNLIYDYYRYLAQPQGLAQHKAGLGHAALECVNEKQNAVYHLKYAFHLAAKVRMARSIHYVYAVALVVYRCVLGKYGYTPLALKVAGVHNPLLHLLVGAEHAALSQKLIHQSGLAVIDVSDNGYIPQFFVLHTLVLCISNKFFAQYCILTYGPPKHNKNQSKKAIVIGFFW